MLLGLGFVPQRGVLVWGWLPWRTGSSSSGRDGGGRREGRCCVSLRMNWSRKVHSRCLVHFCCVQAGRDPRSPRALTDNSPLPGEASGQGFLFNSQREAIWGGGGSLPGCSFPVLGVWRRGADMWLLGRGVHLAHPCLFSVIPHFLPGCCQWPRGRFRVRYTLELENRGVAKGLALPTGRNGQGWHLWGLRSGIQTLLGLGDVGGTWEPLHKCRLSGFLLRKDSFGYL